MKWTKVIGSWVGNGKTLHMRVLDYHGMISFSEVKLNQGGETRKYSFQSKPGENASKTQKTQRNKQREWHRERGWRVDYLWVHPRCASWSCCWSDLEVLIWVVTVYWSWQRLCSRRWQPHMSLRNKQRGKHPGNGETVNHHPGTYKGSYKHASHSYFTSLLDSASLHIQDIQVSTRR